MKTLLEMSREIYGHNGRAINRHSERVYRDARSRRYVLSKNLDGFPPFFEAYGPFKAKHNGVLPRLHVQGQDYWGGGWTWRRAIQAFCRQLDANHRSSRKGDATKTRAVIAAAHPAGGANSQTTRR